MSDSKPMRVLALCDSPAVRPGTAPTGFARVAKNIFTHWSADGKVEIDIWALHFDGWGYRDVPWTLFPGGNRDWNSPARLNAFLNVLASGRYTHVWMLMDADALCVGEAERTFPKMLKACCRKHGIRSMLYFPVDATLEPHWMEIVEAVNAPVTFTEFGRQQVRSALHRSLFPVAVLPHGVDEHFQTATPEERRKARSQIVLDSASRTGQGKPFAGPDDFLLLNVNKNEWRKDPLRSLEILSGLIQRNVPAKMILRMGATSAMGGIHLHRAAAQLGLVDGRDYVQLDAVPEQHLPSLYHAADLYLTTTLGEGWGLGVTEALACGTPVAVPKNTSCLEIGRRIIEAEQGNNAPRSAVAFLELEAGHVCGHDTRVRRRVALDSAVHDLGEWYLHRAGTQQPSLCFAPEESGALPGLPASIRQWLSWERIAGEMLKLLRGA